MTAKGRAFSSSIVSTVPLNPFIEAPKFQSQGWPFGTSLKTRSWNPLDPLQAQADGDLASMEMLFVGNKNFGKTTGMKDWTLVSAMQQAVNKQGEIEDMRVFIDNRKVDERGIGQGVSAEWAGIVDALQCEVFSVSDMRLELIDPGLPDEERIIVAIDIAELAKKQPLDVDEILAIRVALHSVRKLHSRLLITAALERALRTMIPQDYHDFTDRLDRSLEEKFREGDVETQHIEAALNHFGARTALAEADLVIAAARRVSHYLQLVLQGQYGQTFAGGELLSDYLRRPAAMFDLGNLTDDQTAFFEVVRFNTMRAALKKGDLSVIPHIMVREEIQEVAYSLVLLRAWAYWNATARSRHTMTLNSTQYLGNMFSGIPGSPVRQYSEQIYNGMDIFVLFRQSNDDTTIDLLQKLELSPEMISHSMRLPIGAAIVKIKGQPPFTNRFQLTPTVKKLVGSRGSTHRMLSRVPVAKHPHVSKHLKGNSWARV